MDEFLEYIAEEARKGYHCSNILVKMALEMKGSENSELVSAVSALAGGLGYTARYVCGCLTGGLCMLGLFVSKGSDEQTVHPQEKEITAEFVEWFENEIGGRYGSCVCRDIVGPDMSARTLKCPAIIRDTYLQVLEMTEKYGLI